MSVEQIKITAQPTLREADAGLTATVKLEAICSDNHVGILEVRAHADCPRRGQAYSFYGETEASLVCIDVSIDPKPDESGYEGSRVYAIVATYSNAVPSGGLGEDEEDPLDDPPEYEFTFNKYQIPAIADRDGEAVKNGADEMFDPPYTIDENRPVIIITRNEAAFNPSTAIAYQDTVNEHAWAGLDPGVAKINSISARTATRGEVTYAIVTYEIELRWNKWNPTKILAQGFRYRKSEGGPPQNYMDPATEEPPSNPVLLQVNGMLSPPVDGVIPAFFHEFNFYRETDFSALELGL